MKTPLLRNERIISFAYRLKVQISVPPKDKPFATTTSLMEEKYCLHQAVSTVMLRDANTS